MQKTSNMPTWQIFPDAGNSYRWDISGQVQTNKLEPESRKTLINHQTPISHLPSMEDLLIQGSSELFQNCGGTYNEKTPMFQTGSGKPVEVKQSSIMKAMSVFREDNVMTDPGSSVVLRNSKGSMFQTGSGKSVEIKQSSLKKALSVLGEDNGRGSSKLLQNSGGVHNEKAAMFRTGSGKSVEVKQSSIMKARSVIGDNDITAGGSSVLSQHSGGIHVEKPAMFRTGLGNSVEVKQSSVTKALSVLGEEDVSDTGSTMLSQHSGGIRVEKPAMFRTGSGNSVEVKQSSITKALSVLGEEDVTDRGQMHATNNGCGFSDSLFQTGSGKMVNLSPAGLIRAKTLLGLEESSDQFITDESNGWQKSPNLEKRGRGYLNGTVDTKSSSRHAVNGQADMHTTGFEAHELHQGLLTSEVCIPSGTPPSVKFQTAGGRSISVSNDALQRAMSLLGDSEVGDSANKGGANSMIFPFRKESNFNGTSPNKELDPFASRSQHESAKRKPTSTSFLPPKPPNFKENLGPTTIKTFSSGSNFVKQVCKSDSSYEELLRPDHRPVRGADCLSTEPLNPVMHVENPLAKSICPQTTILGRSLGGPLVDITNNIGITYKDQKQIPRDKRRLGKRNSVSPFKRPRHSRFSTPLTSNIAVLPYGEFKSSSTSTSEGSLCKGKMFDRYPFQIKRATVKDFFGRPPLQLNQLEHVPHEVKHMNVKTAETYLFYDASHLDGIGAEGFRNMLAQSGASMQYATKDWVTNHYKWIVWKLACYERGYPAETAGKYLSVYSVLEELKYRYEREVNHAHRSALKRILEGDASPASMVVLCISAIHFNPDERLEVERAMAPYEDAGKLSGLKMGENSNIVKIELTDGWYAVDAILDIPLTKQLVAGKLFVGQKLRIWRAGLCGWVGPISPLEPSKAVSLQLHINGTYRAHWAEKLGFCRCPGDPLAFSCIKSGGGLVPKTLVGVTRVYPILYKEKLNDGVSVVRSERMERKMLQVYNQKRATVAEGIISEFQKDASSHHCKSENDSEEGAKILKILEKSAEPEIIMAEMSTEQLNSFANYQAKQEAVRQSDLEKKIQKAFEDAGLNGRNVTPFFRVRVVGLTSSDSPRKGVCPREGLITIWNPMEKQQQFELAEGQAYSVAGLIPLNSDSGTIYLHARGSTTTWQTLPPTSTASFECFFIPRKPMFLSNMGAVPLASEFDIAAIIVHVGDAYVTGHLKKQWVFVTDGSLSLSELESEESSNCLLAISFCTPSVDNDSSALISYTLAGSTVGFFNLVKRARDPVNHIWVAEATDNSTYSFSYDLPIYAHLKEAAVSACKWAKISSLAIQKLKEKIVFIVGNHRS